MADLSDVNSAGASTLQGAVTLTPVKANLNGQLLVSDALDNSGAQGAISVTSSAVAVRAAGSNLANRKSVSAYNNSALTLYWGVTSGVTTSTGIPLKPGQYTSWNAGPNTTIYLIAASGTNNVRVVEIA